MLHHAFGAKNVDAEPLQEVTTYAEEYDRHGQSGWKGKPIPDQSCRDQGEEKPNWPVSVLWFSVNRWRLFFLFELITYAAYELAVVRTRLTDALKMLLGK